jgi:hypothetical protein
MFSIIKVGQFLMNTLPSGQKMIVLLKCDHVQNFGSRIGNPSDIWFGLAGLYAFGVCWNINLVQFSNEQKFSTVCSS